MDRTLEQLLAIAERFENGLYWPEVLTDNERKLVQEYLMEIYGIG
jgi:3-methyladenine DNA glycosylase/8-oxoguanine DNA glycosylase